MKRRGSQFSEQEKKMLTEAVSIIEQLTTLFPPRQKRTLWQRFKEWLQ